MKIVAVYVKKVKKVSIGKTANYPKSNMHYSEIIFIINIYNN